ncbi:MAG: MFS transporter [Chloroflexales bacterium]|nr:MFS transporter [Chloroflexales bacterium]
MAALPHAKHHEGRPAPSGAAPRRSPLESLRAGFRALRIRNYRLYWLGQIISLTGTWMQTTAQGWLVLQLTHSPLALGLMTTFQFLPSLLLSLFGGVIADRVPKYRLILVTQVAALIQAVLFTLLVGTGAIQLWHVYVLALALGIINALDTPTRQSFVVELVGREMLPNAVALNSLLFNSARVVGPGVAGVLIAQIGLAPAFGLNAASFLAVIGGLLLMRPREFQATPPPPRGSVLAGIREGLAYTWHTPAVMQIMIVMAFVGTFGYNFTVVLPLLSGFVLHTDAVGFGALSAALGVGSLLGALTIAYTSQVSVRRLLLGAAAFSLLLGLTAIVPVLGVALLLLAALGFAGIMFTTSANTLLQLAVPDALRGRVLSLYWMLFAGSTPVGALLIGTLSKAIGVPETLGLCALLSLLGVGLGAAYGRRTT